MTSFPFSYGSHYLEYFSFVLIFQLPLLQVDIWSMPHDPVGSLRDDWLWIGEGWVVSPVGDWCFDDRGIVGRFNVSLWNIIFWRWSDG